VLGSAPIVIEDIVAVTEATVAIVESLRTDCPLRRSGAG
jgi:hypothetical protein